MNRYDWEDALIDAQTAGRIPNGALLVALKLARAINWKPKGNKPAGLYWKNEEALESVGSSRASYFKHRKSLVETGFFTQENGNLLPTIPEKSLVETEKSPVETTESLVETEKSLGDNPLSEDTCSEDVLSEDDVVTTTADAPVVDSSTLIVREGAWYIYKGKKFPNLREAEHERKQDDYERKWNDEDM